ncbi:TPA: hypothetical protein ACGPI0_000764 [Klebsiella pneumoniae]
MAKSTITREQLEEWVAQFDEDGGCDATDRQLEALIRQSLAAMDSEEVRNPVLAYADSYRDMAKQGVESVPVWSVITDLERNIAPLYRHAQPAPVVPEKCPAEIRDLISSHTDALFNDDDAQEIWNACRSAMLQASPVCTCPSGDGSLRWPCPVHPGNSPAISDSARDALEKALAAMEFMGDTLNNLDAVCTEDVELVAPAFDAVRSVLAAALQEGK